MTAAGVAPLFDQWQASGREIAVVGLGKSGVAATLLLRQMGIPVYASDSGSGPRHKAWTRTLRQAGAAVDVAGHDLARIARAGGVVVAPGVPPDVPALETARRAGLEILAEVDIGFLALRKTRCIGITGTNGKTTTTSLIAHVLSAAGIPTETAGNIGRPLCEVASASAPPPWLALELSSFQLHDAPHLKPAVGVLTNLAPNHLDRYRSLEEYYADKAQLFRNAGRASVWVTNDDDGAVQAMSRSVPGRHLKFSTEHQADAWYDRRGRRLMLGSVEALPRAALPLLGDHNVANALAALLVAAELGAPTDKIAKGMGSFRAIPHRVEPVREVDGVLWINDSKSTNVTSTEVAVAALDRPFVLLLGGRHKGEPYTRLIEPLRQGRCRAVVAYGEAGALIAQDLGRQLDVVSAGSFEDVLAQARRLARSGDAVLLSPACSSYDMFTNYEERGERFREAVLAL
jgi:UDP-N-acetylmuramoylalanine--D-glutamate ligase